MRSNCARGFNALFILPEWTCSACYRYLQDPRAHCLMVIPKDKLSFRALDFYSKGQDYASHPQWNIIMFCCGQPSWTGHILPLLSTGSSRDCYTELNCAFPPQHAKHEESATSSLPRHLPKQAIQEARAAKLGNL